MKIHITKQLLESMLINLQPFLEKKDASQITSHLYIEAKNNFCTLKATDSEIGLLIKTDGSIIEEEGKATANGKKLLDIIRILKDDEITLQVINDHLHIQQKKSKFKLPIFNPENFPSFPLIENKSQINIDSINLIKSLKYISSSIDNNNPKFELNGALLNIKSQKTELVGTDTRRLSVATIENQSTKELAIIIPKKAILEIQKLFINQIQIHYETNVKKKRRKQARKKKAILEIQKLFINQIQIHYDENNLIIENENYYFFSRLINGNFPDYERIIPKKSQYQIRLPKKEMIDSIKMITTISQDIKITFLSHSIIFNSLATDNIEAKTEILIETSLENFELNVNSRYLLDFMSQIEDEAFEILLNEPTLPFVLKDKKFITVIMPIIV